jgi:hypothetical protein
MTELFPDLTVSGLRARMKQMDEDIVDCLDSFLSETGVGVLGLIVSFNEESQEYLLDWHLTFLEE